MPKWPVSLSEPRPGRLDRKGASVPASSEAVGKPLRIKEVAALLGFSVWTIRQHLIPRGLPHFRVCPRGKFVFYEAEIMRWMEMRQGALRR